VISRFLSPVVSLFNTVVDARRQKDKIEGLGQIIGRTELDVSDDALNVLNRRDHQVLSGQIVKCRDVDSILCKTPSVPDVLSFPSQFAIRYIGHRRSRRAHIARP
jgi:hypothetical protein